VKSYRVALLAVLVCLLAPSLLHAQLDTAWVRRYDGGEIDEDWASDMTVDGDGNIYVVGTGYAGNLSLDIILQKYDSAGALQWTAVHNGEEDDEDSASALVVDGNGNIYVCGWSYQQYNAGMGMITIKYGPDGDSLWLAAYDHDSIYDDAATDLCLDAQGNVVVTGYASEEGFWNLNYCTISYDTATGDTNWVQFYNRSPEDDEDVANAICADPDGNVYVTGYSYDEGTEYDIVTIKYEPDGSKAWTRRYNNYPWRDEDYGVDVAWDTVTGTLVMGGVVYDDNHDYDYFTMKYSASGDSVWARAYNRYPTNFDDLLTDVAIDQWGYVVVTGMSSDDSTDYDATTVRYDQDGIQQWVSRYDAEEYEDAGTHIVFDSLGQILLTGFAETFAGDYDILTQKLDTSGSRIWTYLYDNSPSNAEDFGCRIAAMPDGHIYVFGTSEDDSTDYDFILFKYYELVHDFAVSAVVAPESLMLGDSAVPRAVVTNWALSDDSCWVKLDLGWTDDYAESLWVSLMPMESDTLTFPAWYPESTGTAVLNCWSELAGDERAWNDTASVSVTVWDDTTGIAGEEPLVRNRFDMALSPNPVRNMAFVRMHLPGPEQAELRLYDVTGSLVVPPQSVRAQSGNGQVAMQLDARLLAAGVYFVKLSQGSRELGRKLVVQR